MKPYFSLWDVETGNSLGTYEQKQEVLQVVESLLIANGKSYLSDLELQHTDRTGRVRQLSILALISVAGESGFGGPPRVQVSNNATLATPRGAVDFGSNLAGSRHVSHG